MGRVFFLIPTLKMLGNDPLKLKPNLLLLGFLEMDNLWLLSFLGRFDFLSV